MSATPYARSIPFGDASMEDVALQYLPKQRQLLITFYYQSIKFACICLKTDEELQPIRIVNHLKKDDQNLRAQFLVSLLNDRLSDLFRTISSANGSSFRNFVRREIGEISYA